MMEITKRTIARRGLLAGAGALAAGAAVAAPLADHPDAELMRLGAQLRVEWAKMDAWDRAHHDPKDDEIEAVTAPATDLVELIEHLPAHTLDGLKVKAFAISWCNMGGEIDPDRFCPYPGATTDARIAASIVRDLLAGAAGVSA